MSLVQHFSAPFKKLFQHFSAPSKKTPNEENDTAYKMAKDGWNSVDSNKKPTNDKNKILIVCKKNGMRMLSTRYDSEKDIFLSKYDSKIYSVLWWIEIPFPSDDDIGRTWFRHCYDQIRSSELNKEDSDIFPYFHYREIKESGFTNVLLLTPKGYNPRVTSAYGTLKPSFGLVDANEKQFKTGYLYRYI